MTSKSALLVVSGALMLSACSYGGAKDLPLPGAIGGANTYAVTSVLADATNLVVKESCRSNNTIVGSVESITLDKNLRARITCRIKNSVTLPANTVATLSQTSLLGERFVALDPPSGQDPRGKLARNSTLSPSGSGADPDTEVVLGALSQVLNGGSLGSIQTISRELDTALRGSDVGGTVDSLRTVTGALNDHRTQITSTLDSLDSLTGKLADQREVIASALDSIPGGLAVLNRQRPALVKTLQRVQELTQVAVPLIQDTRANTVADLKHLQPVLSQLTKAGDELALTLERFVTFPFSSNAMSVIRGDYGGMYGTVELDIDSLNELLSGTILPLKQPTGAAVQPQASGSGQLLPDLPLISGLVDLLGGLGAGGAGQNGAGATAPGNTGLSGLIGSLLGGGS